MAEWHEPDPGQKDHPLTKIKMKCGCYTYYQRGSGYSIYTLLVSDRCNRDHELAAGPNAHPPGEGTIRVDAETTFQAGTKIVKTQLDQVKPPRLSEN